MECEKCGREFNTQCSAELHQCQPSAASAGYRLLTDEDVIQTGDEFLDDDAETWVPVGRDSSIAEMWMIGMVYSTRGILKPFRRIR